MVLPLLATFCLDIHRQASRLQMEFTDIGMAPVPDSEGPLQWSQVISAKRINGWSVIPENKVSLQQLCIWTTDACV